MASLRTRVPILSSRAIQHGSHYHPRMRMIQYCRDGDLRSKSCGVLDTRLRGV